jgi:hypothetical protein
MTIFEQLVNWRTGELVSERRAITNSPTRQFAKCLLAVFAAGLLLQPADAQIRFTYTKGQTVSPSYEGWMPNDDGSFTMYFGYMNTNWEEQFDVPVGPDNTIEPGGPDQGQPTHFYPRRNPFLFTIRVPKDFGNKELIWTLTTHGKTEKAYASLKTDYEINKQVISTEVGGDGGSLCDCLRENIPPTLTVEGDKRRSVKVGEPLTLVAITGDPDNMPARRDGKPQPGTVPELAAKAEANGYRRANRQAQAAPQGRGQTEGGAAASANSPNVIYRPPGTSVPSSGPGLRLSWIVYRGKAATVKFDPEQMKTWTDSRAYANSPWSPPYTIPEPPADGKFVAQASFQEPGTYVLRAVASDGSIFTYDNVTVTVTR